MKCITRGEASIGLLILATVATFALMIACYEYGRVTAENHAANRRIENVLRNEKVCSEHNRGLACRALFDRLAASLTHTQRKRVGCNSLYELRGDGIAEILRASHCPPPPPTDP